MRKKVRCCMPGCLSITKHSSIYDIKPLWWPLIHAYIKKVVPNFVTTPKLLSQMICARHIRSCGIKDKPLEGPVHFPFLKISVSGQVQNDQLSHRVFSSAEIVVGHEETIPLAKVTINNTEANLTKQKRILIQKTYPFDHTYVSSASKLKLLQDEVARLGNENTALNNQIARETAEFNKELQHFDNVTHRLVKTNIKHITPGIDYPFKCMPENEQILQFYTGFSNRSCFLNLVEIIRPKYDQARQINSVKQTLVIENQLILFLSRIRLGLMLEDLAYRFNISVPLVVQTWIFWLNLMNDVLVKESLNWNTKSCRPESNRKMLVECCETFFELKTPHSKTRKMYGRARCVLELTAHGCVFNVSDLFTAQAKSAQFMDSTQSLIKGDRETSKTFEEHVQKTLWFVKGFKILKGAFPNATCDVDEINTFWKICCFLMNFSHSIPTITK